MQLREVQNSPDSRYHILIWATAKSSGVSTSSITDLVLDQIYPGYFDHCYCLTLWWIYSSGTWHPPPPSSIPYRRNCKLKTTLPQILVNKSMLYANRISQWNAFLRDSESKKRNRGHFLTILVLARKVGGSCFQQPDASSCF